MNAEMLSIAHIPEDTFELFLPYSDFLSFFVQSQGLEPIVQSDSKTDTSPYRAIDTMLTKVEATILKQMEMEEGTASEREGPALCHQAATVTLSTPSVADSEDNRGETVSIAADVNDDSGELALLKQTFTEFDIYGNNLDGEVPLVDLPTVRLTLL